MIKSNKYSESLRAHLRERGFAGTPDVAGWLGTLSDTELAEFGELTRAAARGKPTEDVACFISAAMSRQAADAAPGRKELERFLTGIYSNVVSERKYRLQMRGKLVHKPAGHAHCSCCSHD